MPRYAIKPARALTTIYTEADTVLDAVNWARRVLIEQARHGNLTIALIREEPFDEGDAQSELRYEHPDDARDEAAKDARMALEGRRSDSERPEPW